jgi:hypothetical protein
LWSFASSFSAISNRTPPSVVLSSFFISKIGANLL